MTQPICASHSLGDIVARHSHLLLLLSRFGIHLGFADKSVEQVCQECGVDTGTFLAVANGMAAGGSSVPTRVSARQMSDFVRRSHDYYIGSIMPDLRQRLLSVLTASDAVADLVLRLFDGYASSLADYVRHEDALVLLLAGDSHGNASSVCPEEALRESALLRGSLMAGLAELCDSIVRYVPSHSLTTEVDALLRALLAFEHDLRMHFSIVGNVFMPALMPAHVGSEVKAHAHGC